MRLDLDPKSVDPNDNYHHFRNSFTESETTEHTNKPLHCVACIAAFEQADVSACGYVSPA